MNSKIIKGFLAGFIVALMLTTTFSSYAETGKKQLNAVYNNIKLIVNGTPVPLVDSNGNNVEPFIVAGTTYLPVKVLADALGQEVRFDKDINAIVVGKEKLSGKIGIVDLLKKIPLYESFYGRYASHLTSSGNSSFYVLQEKYSASNNFSGSGTILLKGDFKRLTGILASPDGENSASLEIKGDGKVLFSYKDLLTQGVKGSHMGLYSGQKPANIDIDLTGVDKLEISSYNFFNVVFEPIGN